MSPHDASAPAARPARVEGRRFLHCCYCCDDAEAVARRFERHLGLEPRMRSAGARVDGSQMGFDGDVETDARFLYDRRGPRTSPAIEVQEWIDPPAVGAPYAAAHDVGIQALGIGLSPGAHGGPDRAASALVTDGATVVGRATDAPATFGATVVTLRDPTGVHLDLVEHEGLGEHSQLVHLRATCSDLARSVAWYEALGFDVVAREAAQPVPGVLFGLPGDATASWARLCLPDEPFALLLVAWQRPRSRGRPYETGNHRGLYRFAIAVDDTRAAYSALEREWGLSSPPQRVALAGTKVPEMWIAFLSDPDGLVVELVERPRAAFR